MPAAIPIIAAAISAAASIYGAVKGSGAAKDAAQIQAEASANALQFSKDVYAKQQQQIAPYLGAGTNALNQLSYLTGISPSGTAYTPPTRDELVAQAKQTIATNVGSGSLEKSIGDAISGLIDQMSTEDLSTMLGVPSAAAAGTPVTAANALGTFGELTQGFDPTKAGVPTTFKYGTSDFQVDPGYMFALSEGQKAIQRSAAAKGGLVSGGTLKDLDAYTQGLANQQYSTAYNRALATYQQNYSNLFNTFETDQQNKFNRLNALVNTGLTATGMSNASGTNYASSAGQYAINAGNALATGEIGSANAIASGIAGVGSAFNNALYYQQLMDAVKGYTSGVSPNLDANGNPL